MPAEPADEVLRRFADHAAVERTSRPAKLTTARMVVHSARSVRRLTGAILVVLFLALGSGVMEFAHQREHAREDARDAKPPHHQHDESNCSVCAMVRAPIVSTGWTPLLVCLGLFVAFLTLLIEQPTLHHPLTRLDCRGPPA